MWRKGLFALAVIVTISCFTITLMGVPVFLVNMPRVLSELVVEKEGEAAEELGQQDAAVVTKEVEVEKIVEVEVEKIVEVEVEKIVEVEKEVEVIVNSAPESPEISPAQTLVANVCNQTYVASFFDVDPTKLSAPGWGCPEGNYTGAWVYSNESQQPRTVTVPAGTVVDYHCTRFTPGQSVTIGAGEKGSFHFFPTEESPNSVGVGCGGQEGIGQEPIEESIGVDTQDRDALFGQCFLSKADIANVVGGKAEDWTEPDWEEGAWVFDAGQGNWIELTVPSWGGRIDYWESESNPNAQITSGSISIDKASFHCPSDAGDGGG